jgi:C4-dicarboxylate-specific signal transduction histidine kinase
MRGDRIQLQQVLLNLLLNAMDAVSDSSPDRRRVAVRVQYVDSRVEVVVSDSGSGIPADKLAHVFEPFFTSKQSGMGLGLPISRTIIEAHGGSIRAQNDPDGGATFCFSLPVVQEGNAS